MSSSILSSSAFGTNVFKSVISYPLAVINAFVAAALLYLYLPSVRAERNWSPPFRATWPVALLFLLSNIYLVIAPFIPPNEGQNVYVSLPYYLHCLVGIGILAAGGVYWVVWAVVLPRIGGYELVRETRVDSIDGWERNVFSRRKLEFDEKRGRATGVAISQ